MEKDIALKLHFVEDDTETVVSAALVLGDDSFDAVGRARRNPIDPPMPVIGEELAVARALQDLTAQVMEAAQGKIEEYLVAD